MIGVLTTSYPRFPGDPAGCFVEARVRALRDAGAELEVLAAGPGAGADAVASVPGIAVHRVPFAVAGAPPLFYAGGAPEALEARSGPALLQGARFYAGLLATARARLHRWRRIESHWLIPCGLAAVELHAGRPHRAHAHSGDVALLERLPGGGALARRLCASGVELVFASADLRARFARLAGPSWAAVAGRVVVEAAPSPLRPATLAADEREELRRRLGLSGMVVLGVGRLVPVKGYDVLVRAVARLAPATRPTLVLVGDGPERPVLARLAADRGVALRLAGEVPQAAVAQWLAAADLFVHPCRQLANGRREGLPLAAREAVEAGLPVIASACGGLVELGARAPRCELLPPEDPGALADALGRWCAKAATHSVRGGA